MADPIHPIRRKPPATHRGSDRPPHWSWRLNDLDETHDRAGESRKIDSRTIAEFWSRIDG